MKTLLAKNIITTPIIFWHFTQAPKIPFNHLNSWQVVKEHEFLSNQKEVTVQKYNFKYILCRMCGDSVDRGVTSLGILYNI